MSIGGLLNSRDLVEVLLSVLNRTVRYKKKIVCPKCGLEQNYKEIIRICKKCTRRLNSNLKKIERKIRRIRKKLGFERANICPLCRTKKLSPTIGNQYYRCKNPECHYEWQE
jgi:hypothetical protein